VCPSREAILCAIWHTLPQEANDFLMDGLLLQNFGEVNYFFIVLTTAEVEHYRQGSM
jgi:hypothetical protein